MKEPEGGEILHCLNAESFIFLMFGSTLEPEHFPFSPMMGILKKLGLVGTKMEQKDLQR